MDFFLGRGSAVSMLAQRIGGCQLADHLQERKEEWPWNKGKGGSYCAYYAQR
jgi:hypothetical protein